MSQKTKTRLTVILCLGTLLITGFFWTNTLYTVLLLGLTSVCMLIVERSKHALVIYFVAFFLGPLSEAWMISRDAWTYADPHFLGIPLWLPFLWGNASLMFNRINQYLQAKK